MLPPPVSRHIFQVKYTEKCGDVEWSRVSSNLPQNPSVRVQQAPPTCGWRFDCQKRCICLHPWSERNRSWCAWSGSSQARSSPHLLFQSNLAVWPQIVETLRSTWNMCKSTYLNNVVKILVLCFYFVNAECVPIRGFVQTLCQTLPKCSNARTYILIM